MIMLYKENPRFRKFSKTAILPYWFSKKYIYFVWVWKNKWINP